VSRLLWTAAGAVVGVVVVRKVSEAARRATPESVVDAGGRFASAVGSKASQGVGSQVRRLADAVTEFTAVVRESAAEREELLRSALGVDAETGGLGPEEARRLLEHPTQRHQEDQARHSG